MDPVTYGSLSKKMADPEKIATAVSDWLDDHPEATTTVQDGSITQAKLDSDLSDSIDDISVLKNAITSIDTATASDVGKALSPKTVTNGKVTEWQFENIGGGGGGGAVDDVQLDGTSIVDGDGVANIPPASASSLGLVQVDPSCGIGFAVVVVDDELVQTNKLTLVPATNGEARALNDTLKPIACDKFHRGVFFGLAKAAGADMASISGATVGTYPAAQKSAIQTMLDAPESVSGTTPSITALPGVRYVCGECSTLSVVAPASGCIDVTFTSGSTPTVLTVTSAKANTTIKWANGFDPTSLEANTTYEINILDGEFGVVGSWT